MMSNNNDTEQHTTHAQDLQNAASLQARLSKLNDNEQRLVANGSNTDGNDDSIDNDMILPAVSIDEGAHKYVLITATSSSNLPRTFVYSRRNAKYHVNVAEEIVPQLESNGYRSIRVAGGGRILRNDSEKKIHIFGYSYGFGKADHAVAKEVVEQSVNYRGYDVSW
jgi:phosphohistidine phosphatase